MVEVSVELLGKAVDVPLGTSDGVNQRCDLSVVGIVYPLAFEQRSDCGRRQAGGDAQGKKTLAISAP